MQRQREPPIQGIYLAYFICWLLGIGCLFSWNSMLTIEDYYSAVFPRYHPTRVLILVYQPFALLTLSILAYNEARLNTHLRILLGFCIFFLSSLFIPLLDIGTFGHGGIGPFVGICLASALFGVADAHVQGGMAGDLSYMRPEFLQSFFAGLAASGTATSVLRMVTKAAFEDSQSGLRRGALTFFFISTFFVLICIVLYAFVFPHLEVVKYYRTIAASQGAKTIAPDLITAGMASASPEQDPEANKQGCRLSTLQLFVQNIDLVAALFLVYTLSLSIFPGFLAEDTGSHHLGSWYAIVLIAMFNVGDFLARYIPLIEKLRLESRCGLLLAACSRFLLIPTFYFTAKYGTQGWMLFLCVVLGLSNGYLTSPNGLQYHSDPALIQKRVPLRKVATDLGKRGREGGVQHDVNNIEEKQQGEEQVERSSRHNQACMKGEEATVSDGGSIFQQIAGHAAYAN
ncbi:hypothetical protein L7F22_042832 [Adiantum nelumboides]|nr:hypothetical protein [Adiantum nelumboides]